jgi:hypothetical protein
MSKEYDKYLETHSANIRKAFYWIRKSLPELLIDIPGVDYELNILLHDDTKTVPSEYKAFDEYYYGEHTKYTVQNYRLAYLEHIHRNPHHWQYWILINPDGTKVNMDMPYEYIIEMICDWWARSWEEGDVYSIFSWYDENKTKIKLSKRTKDTVEDILRKINSKLVLIEDNKKKRESKKKAK